MLDCWCSFDPGVDVDLTFVCYLQLLADLCKTPFFNYCIYILSALDRVLLFIVHLFVDLLSIDGARPRGTPERTWKEAVDRI